MVNSGQLTYAIRPAVLSDCEGLYAVEVDCFSIPWSKESIEADLAAGERALYYVIEVAGEIIGYAGAWLVADEGQITNIAVKKAFRREGYGAILTRKIQKELFKRGAEEIFLEVRLSNVAALELYRRLGFTVKGIRKNYYQEPVEDAYVMSVSKEEAYL